MARQVSNWIERPMKLGDGCKGLLGYGRDPYGWYPYGSPSNVEVCIINWVEREMVTTPTYGDT